MKAYWDTRQTTRELREGHTTGSTATAAAMGAFIRCHAGKSVSSVLIPLPPFTEDLQNTQSAFAWHQLPIHDTGPGVAPESAPLPEQVREWEALCWACSIKDGGDDPDATNGMGIYATILRAPDTGTEIPIVGGKGIGMVTLPGLGLPVGKAAINPVPQAQIRYGLTSLAVSNGWSTRSVAVLITAPQGEERARKTLNSRLGIIGGISILGTHGIVRPYSHEAWGASIALSVRLAASARCETICFSTGRRSERLLMARYGALPPLAFVQAGDMAGYSLELAGKTGFKKIVWGCYFGKLVKLAQGLSSTHAHEGDLDMSFLSGLCGDWLLERQIKTCATARAALELIMQHQDKEKIIGQIMARAKKMASDFARRDVKLHLFNMNGEDLASL